MNRRTTIATAVILLIASAVLFSVASKMPSKARVDNSDSSCWFISLSQATGTIECWSGGILVYSNHIYYNGGVLCATDGHEIKITGGKSLCVIESNQDSSWEPPIATDTEQ